ncbi:hypothetical protein ACE193_05705 [Bernardetia sp. OM2101]|uniref:hypothetical protein n=1 Tax=Bernardetia sp. OM2101 TaxID=3344876 RepID=UPI0035D01C08
MYSACSRGFCVFYSSSLFSYQINKTSQSKSRVNARKKKYTRLKQKIVALRSQTSFFDKNKFLSGSKDRNYRYTTTTYQTPSLDILASNIYLNASSFGNHSSNQPQNVDVKYWEMPTKYAIKSVFYALLEQLIWFKELMRRI